jgi:hypothetical protein
MIWEAIYWPWIPEQKRHAVVQYRCLLRIDCEEAEGFRYPSAIR